MGTKFDKIVRGWMSKEKMSGYTAKSAFAEELLNLAIAGKDKVKISSVINMIECLPASDVAPVVRCKDCKYFSPQAGWDGGQCSYLEGKFELSEVLMLDDDYCSDGERREGESE